MVCQDSFEGLVRIILDLDCVPAVATPPRKRGAAGFRLRPRYRGGILDNCPIPHFKIDRPLGCRVWDGKTSGKPRSLAPILHEIVLSKGGNAKK